VRNGGSDVAIFIDELFSFKKSKLMNCIENDAFLDFFKTSTMSLLTLLN